MSSFVPIVISGVGGVTGAQIASCLLQRQRALGEQSPFRLVAGTAPGKTREQVLANILGNPDSGFPRLPEDFDFSGLTIIDERDARRLRWSQFACGNQGVVVLEASDQYRSRELAGIHLETGAAAVWLACPPSGDCDLAIVPGVTDHLITGIERFGSMLSCTTLGFATIVHALVNHIDIARIKGITVHSYTASDLKTPEGRERALRDIVPSTTGASKSLEFVFPDLRGKIDLTCIRVPVADISYLDLEFVPEPGTSSGVHDLHDLARVFTHYTQQYPTNLRVMDKVGKGALPKKRTSPHTSHQFVGEPVGFVVDMSLCTVSADGRISVRGYYPNTFGYAAKVAGTTELLAYKRLGLQERTIAAK